MRLIPTRYSRKVRARVVEYCQFLYNHRAAMGYAEVRPMRSFPTAYRQIPAHDTDCSESSAIILEASGAPTPYVVKDEGYTGTMLATLPHIPKYVTRRGDFAVFVHPDRPGGDHVVILTQGGLFHRDPEVFSHGRPGVDVMPLSQMQAGFPGCATVFLRSVPLELKP